MQHAVSLRLILILGALTAFAPFSIDMYLPSLPTLERAFGSTSGAVQLTLSFFLIGLAVGQLFYGPLSDRFGRKPPLYVGLLLYILASVACAFAPDVESMMALRFVQGFGGCAGVVIARAVVRDLVTGQEAARVFSLLMLVMGVAPILAPLAGGYILVWLDWQAIFHALAIFGALCLLAVVAGMPETGRRSTLPGSVTRVLGVYARLLAQRRFMGYALASGFAMGGMFVYITGSPHLFIDIYGVPSDSYGWLFGINAAGLIAASQSNRVLLRRHSWHSLLVLGLWINLLAALALAAVAWIGIGGLPALLVPLFFTIASLGFVAPNATAAALAGDPAHAGSASALLGTMPYIVGALAAVVMAASGVAPGRALASTIAGCAVVAFASFTLLAGQRAVQPPKAVR